MDKTSLDLLKTFVTFANSSSMSEAAEKLGMSQPAVTFQLKKLQENLPVSLFAQKGNRKVLTHFGKALNASLHERFDDLEICLKKVNYLYTSPESYTYRIGGRREVLGRILPKLNICGTFEFINLNEEEVVQQLIQHKIDVAITFENFHRSDIFQKELFSDQGLFCVHKKFLKGKTLDLSIVRNLNFLTETPVITYNRKFPYLKEWLDSRKGKVSDLKVKCIYEDWNAIIDLVAQGIGYSIVPSEVKIHNENVVSLLIPKEVIPSTVFSAFFHQDLLDLGVVEQMFSEF